MISADVIIDGDGFWWQISEDGDSGWLKVSVVPTNPTCDPIPLPVKFYQLVEVKQRRDGDK